MVESGMPLNTLQCMGQPPTMKNSLPWNGNGTRAEERWFRHRVSWFNVSKIRTTALFLHNIKSSSIRFNSRPLIPYVHLHPVFCLFPWLERRWTYGILGHPATTKDPGSLLHQPPSQGRAGKTFVYWAKTQSWHFMCTEQKLRMSSLSCTFPFSHPSPLPFHFSLFIFLFCSLWCDSIWKSQNVSFVQFNSWILCNTYLLSIFISH